MRKSTVALLVLWGALPLLAQGPGAATLVLTHANVIDGGGGAVLRDATVVVRAGKIAEIAGGPARTSPELVVGAPPPTAGGLTAPPGATVLDLRGKYLLPGLIDAHVHVADVRQADVALKSGVTTLRSMGVQNFADVGLRELGKTEAVDLPEVLAAGYHVRPQLDPSAFLNDASLAPLMRGIHGPAAYRQVVAFMIKNRVDWIKTTPTERAGTFETDPRKQIMSEEEMVAIVEEAKKAGLPVAAHAHGDEGGRAAVRAGVRSIEHGSYLSDETLLLMKEKGTYLAPTVAVVADLTGPGGDYDHPLLQNRGRHMLPRVRELVARARDRGVKIVAATDTRYGPDSTLRLSHELEELVRSGLTPMAAIQAATTTAAELLGIEKRTGAIRAGLEADIIAVERNPLDDIVSLQDVLLVVNNGKVVLNRLSMAMPGTSSALVVGAPPPTAGELRAPPSN